MKPSMSHTANLVPSEIGIAAPIDPAANTGLDALLSSISEAIESLVTWDLPAFQSAIERQRVICDHLARQAEWRRSPTAAATAHKVRELNRVYDRLLRHSMHWTRTLQSIFEAAGNPPPANASVHFRG
jgi:hypothetical protein